VLLPQVRSLCRDDSALSGIIFGARLEAPENETVRKTVLGWASERKKPLRLFQASLSDTEHKLLFKRFD